jgi:heme/copper-type cytochrome/quinol oxidase subunit 4
MTDQQATSSGQTTRNRTLSFVLSVYLIAAFLWRVFTPAHEFSMRTEQVMQIAFDILAVVGLIALRAQIPKALFWIALIVGLALFAIRLSSGPSWWTGHLVYTLPPR